MTILAKHYGPGPHKNGSPQSVHGGGSKTPPPNRNDELAGMLNRRAEMMSRYSFASREQSVLDHGHPYRPPESAAKNLARMKEYGIEPGMLKACFENAGRAIIVQGGGERGLTYVEGFALAPDMPIVISHAWVVTNDGQVIDPTWSGAEVLIDGTDELATSSPGVAYYGIPFTDTEWLMRRFVKQKYWGLFQGGQGERELIDSGALETDITKHYGPGPHKNGTPQSVHGGKSGGSKSNAPPRTGKREDIEAWLQSEAKRYGFVDGIVIERKTRGKYIHGSTRGSTISLSGHGGGLSGAPETQAPIGIAAHELGHLLFTDAESWHKIVRDAWIAEATFQLGLDDVRHVRDWTHKAQTRIERQLKSSYALKSHDELFAEAYAVGRLRKNPPPLAKGAVEFIDAWLKPKSITKHDGPVQIGKDYLTAHNVENAPHDGRFQRAGVGGVPGQSKLDVGEAGQRISAFDYLAAQGGLPPRIMQDREKYPDSAEYNYADEVYGEWQGWKGCREIRQSAMEQVSDIEATTEAVDPHQYRWPGPGYSSPADPEPYAFYTLDQVHEGYPIQDDIYRAVQLNEDEAETFWNVVQEGKEFDAPLLAFATEHKRGSNEFLGPMFGDDVLMVVQRGAKAWYAPNADFYPLYAESDEQGFLDTMDEIFVEEASQAESDPDMADNLPYYKEMRQTIRDYRSHPTADKFKEIADAAEGYDIPAKRAGAKIDESEDPDAYYEVLDYSEENPHEVISGGRFHVVSVRDDPDGDYGKIVTVKQVGTFDPFTGKLVEKVEKRAVPILDVKSFNQPLIPKRGPVKKHYGPGPHKNGTPQSVHAGKGPTKPQPAETPVKPKQLVKPETPIKPKAPVTPAPKAALPKPPSPLTSPGIMSKSEIAAYYQPFIDRTESGSDRWLELWDEQMNAVREEGDKVLDLYATGKITKEEFEKYGFDPHGTDYRKWEALPDTLYHATTAAEEIYASGGLKTRSEIGGSHAGLGGGTADMISFTDNPDTARAIADSMREVHDIGTGKLTAQGLVDQAKKGGFLGRVVSYYQSDWKPGDPLPQGLRNVIENRRHINNTMWYRTDDPDAAEMQARRLSYIDDIATVDTVTRTNPNGIKVVTGWDVTFTPEGQARQTMELYKTFSAFREEATGRLDPLFWGTDPVEMAKTPREDIGVVVAHPIPGAKGEKKNALGEWRISTGEAVTVNPEERFSNTPTPPEYDMYDADTLSFSDYGTGVGEDDYKTIKFYPTGGVSLAEGDMPTTPESRALVLNSSGVESWWSGYGGCEMIRESASDLTTGESWPGVHGSFRDSVPVDVGFSDEWDSSVSVETNSKQIAYTYLKSMQEQDSGDDIYGVTPTVTERTLWRGVDFEKDQSGEDFYRRGLTLNPGDTVEWGLASTSPDKSTARSFTGVIPGSGGVSATTRGRSEPNIMLEIEPGAKALNTSDPSFEVITGGRFEVIKRYGGQEGDDLHLVLRQVGVFDPDTGKITKRAAWKIDQWLRGPVRRPVRKVAINRRRAELVRRLKRRRRYKRPVRRYGVPRRKRSVLKWDVDRITKAYLDEHNVENSPHDGRFQRAGAGGGGSVGSANPPDYQPEPSTETLTPHPVETGAPTEHPDHPNLDEMRRLANLPEPPKPGPEVISAAPYMTSVGPQNFDPNTYLYVVDPTEDMFGYCKICGQGMLRRTSIDPHTSPKRRAAFKEHGYIWEHLDQGTNLPFGLLGANGGENAPSWTASERLGDLVPPDTKIHPLDRTGWHEDLVTDELVSEPDLEELKKRKDAYDTYQKALDAYKDEKRGREKYVGRAVAEIQQIGASIANRIDNTTSEPNRAIKVGDMVMMKKPPWSTYSGVGKVTSVSDSGKSLTVSFLGVDVEGHEKDGLQPDELITGIPPEAIDLTKKRAELLDQYRLARDDQLAVSELRGQLKADIGYARFSDESKSRFYPIKESDIKRMGKRKGYEPFLVMKKSWAVSQKPVFIEVPLTEVPNRYFTDQETTRTDPDALAAAEADWEARGYRLVNTTELTDSMGWEVNGAWGSGQAARKAMRAIKKVDIDLKGVRFRKGDNFSDSVVRELSRYRDIGGSDINFRSQSAGAQMAEHVEPWLPTDWVDASNRLGKLSAAKRNARGEYNPTNQRIRVDNMETVLHELGHRFEHAMPEIKDLEAAYYKKRTGEGEGLMPLTRLFPGFGYGRREHARPDEFTHAYMGKTYTDGSFELLSMGMERVFSSDSVAKRGEKLMDVRRRRAKGYKDHPRAMSEDFRSFILGLLAVAGEGT